MPDLLKYLLSFVVVTSTITVVPAQFLIENNSAAAKAALGLHTETGHYEMLDSTVCLMWVKEFDERGLLTMYKDHWQCGRPYWNYTYTYDERGQCVASMKSSYEDDFKPIDMVHYFDGEGRLIKRIAADSLSHPTVEHIEYDDLGRIDRITFDERSGKEGSGPWTREWNGITDYALIDLETVYDKDGSIRWKVRRKFTLH